MNTNHDLRMVSLPPKEFEIFWRKKAEFIPSYQMKREAFINPCAEYYTLNYPAEDGVLLQARYICPSTEYKVPTVLMFHDYGRGVRGWHHMTRFLALGYAVLALENRANLGDVTAGYRTAPDGLAIGALFSDALSTAKVAKMLPRTDPQRLITWGEGLGGGLAIAVAAIEAAPKCAAQNPLPACFYDAWASNCCEGLYGSLREYFRNNDPEHEHAVRLFRALEYVDCANFASLLQGELLIGISLMDTVAPPITQAKIFQRACCKKKKIEYPKYAHERINFFENELLKFMHF